MSVVVGRLGEDGWVEIAISRDALEELDPVARRRLVELCRRPWDFIRNAAEIEQSGDIMRGEVTLRLRLRPELEGPVRFSRSPALPAPRRRAR